MKNEDPQVTTSPILFTLVGRREIRDRFLKQMSLIEDGDYSHLLRSNGTHVTDVEALNIIQSRMEAAANLNDRTEALLDRLGRCDPPLSGGLTIFEAQVAGNLCSHLKQDREAAGRPEPQL